MSSSMGNELTLEMEEDDTSPPIPSFEKEMMVSSDKTMIRKRSSRGRGGFSSLGDRGGRDDARNSYDGIAPLTLSFMTVSLGFSS